MFWSRCWRQRVWTMAKYESVQIEGLDALAKALKELPDRVAKNGLRAAVYAGAKADSG
jgi:hypothetical protein